MKVGYARISTTQQSLDLQTDALRAAGCEKIFTDTASGAKQSRPGLDEALAYVRTGDQLVVWKLDRAGRSLAHLVALVGQLNAKGIELLSLQDNIDTSTPGGKFLFHIFASVAEFERDMIRERTNAGLEAARARGRRGGRKPKMDATKIEAAQAMRQAANLTDSEIARTLGVSEATYYRHLAACKAQKAS